LWLSVLSWIDEYGVYLIISSIASVAVISLLYLYFSGKTVKEKVEKPSVGKMDILGVPKPSVKFVFSGDAEKARDELRVLDVERNILSYAIRHLYEAHAEGRITEEERDRLVAGYRERMMRINEAIERNQSIIALHELERMREDLLNLFNKRFEEIENRISELRSRLGIEVFEEAALPPIERPKKVEAPPKAERVEKRRVRRKRAPPAKPVKSEVEEKIEKIREEVEKALERLGQVEA